MLVPRRVGPSESERGDAWYAEQGLAGVLGAFDAGDLEEPFGRVVEKLGKIRRSARGIICEDPRG